MTSSAKTTILACAALLALTSSCQTDDATESVAAIDPPALAGLPPPLTDPVLPRSPLRDTALQERAVDARVPGTAEPGAPVQTLSLSPEVFDAPPALGPDGQIAGLGAPPPMQAEALSLVIEGRTHTFARVDRTLDARYGFTHVTMRSTDRAGGLARFSIGPHGAIAGTIELPGMSYRIVPADPGTQQVFRVSSLDRARASHGSIGRDGLAPHASSLERRHVQLAALADIQPEVAQSSEPGRSAYLRGGRLGRLTTGPITPADIAGLLSQHASVVFAPERLEVGIRSVTAWSGGRSIDFQQLIGGIPVSQRNRIKIAEDGSVVELDTQLVDASKLAPRRMIAPEDAAGRAARAIEDQLAMSASDLSIGEPRLSYHVTADRGLVPRYDFTAEVRSLGPWRVVVDAYTGDSHALEAGIPAAGFRVCHDPFFNTNPLDCNQAQKIWVRQVDAPTAVCQIPNRPRDGAPICPMNAPTGSRRAAEDVIAAVEVVGQSNPALCCSKVGGPDRSIDLLIQSGAYAPSAGVAYYPERDVIASPVGVGGMSSVEVVAHELGHHIFQQYNPQLAALYNQPGEVFLSSFMEAYADMIQAATAEMTPVRESFNYGDPWILGDGTFGSLVSPPRNLKDPNVDFTRLTLNLTNHERGRAITSYLFRVKQASGISSARFMELLLKVADVLRDYDSNGLDLIDLKGALFQSTSASETALRAAIDSNFDTMYAPLPGNGSGPLPVGVPAPVGSPPPPFPVTGVLTGCGVSNGSPVSLWRVDWPAVPGATHYVGYLKFQFSTFIQDTATTSSLTLNAFTNVGAFVMIASCNAQGCGRASVAARITHAPLCQNF